MNFWQLTKESVYSPEFYASLRQKSFRFSDVYLLKLLSIFALLSTALIAPAFLTFVRVAEESFEDQLVSRLPESFLLTVKDGVALTNIEQPFKIPEKEISLDGASARTSFVVIDTRKPFTPEQFKAQNTIFWIAKDGMASKDNQAVEFTSFKELDADVAVSKADVMTFSGYLKKTASVLRFAIVPITFFLVLIGNIIGNALYLIFGALVVMLVGKLQGYSFKYGESYRIGMHLLTLPLAISYLLWMLGVQIIFVPTIILAILAFANFPRIAKV